MENSMKKLILVAAALMLLSVSLMGITFSINVINWKPGTEVTISGWVGIGGGGNWTVLPNLPMEKVGPNSGGNGYIFRYTSSSTYFSGYDVTVRAGNQSSSANGTVALNGNHIWLDSINLVPIIDPIIDDPIHR